MSVASRLLDLLSAASRPGRAANPVGGDRLAAAALLIHVARVDGRLVEAERARLEELARTSLGVPGSSASALIEAAAEAEREGEGLASLVERIGRGQGERRRLLTAAYAVAAADGRLHEFEEDLVWRLGRLFGFGEAEIVAIRDAALAER